jgi:hypothetical protein
MKDVTLKSHRGPDRIEGNTGVAAARCTFWSTTPTIVFGKGGFEKQ